MHFGRGKELRKIIKSDVASRAVSSFKYHFLLELSLNSPFWRLFVFMEMVQPIPTRTLSRARGWSMRTHLTAVEL